MQKNTESSGASLKTYLKWLGSALALLATAYLILELANAPAELWNKLLSVKSLIAILALSCGYGLSLFFVYFAWLALLGQRGRAIIGIRSSLEIYSLFQVLKYVPSNVMHQVGRYAMLKQRGLSHRLIIWTSVAEVATIIICAVAVTILTGGSAYLNMTSIRFEPILQICFGMTFVAGILLLAVWLKLRGRLERILAMGRSVALSVLLAIFCYLAFFLLTGLLLNAVTMLLASGNGTLHPLILIGANSASWVAGFITPGSPGGIGIREFVLMESLKPFGIEGHAILVVAAYRFVSTLGDAFFFLVARISMLLFSTREPQESITN